MDKFLLDDAHAVRTSLRATPRAVTLVVVLLFTVGIDRPLRADPARFWISPASAIPTGPVAPDLPIVNGVTQSYDVWAQPATTGAGAFSGGNPFKTMGSFSLNLVANASSQSIIEIVDSSLVVYNSLYTPSMSTARKRWSEINDNTTGLLAAPTSPTGNPQTSAAEGFANMFGYMLSPSSTIVGIGGSGCNSDPQCIPLAGGAPAWRVASFAIKGIQPSGAANYFLQIGSVGMLHLGDVNESAGTSVAFGIDAFGADAGPTYNASTQRNTTISATDSFDLSLDARASLLGDFNQDGVVNALDYSHWRNNLGDANETDIGNNGNGGPIDESDFTVWKSHYGESTLPGAGGIVAIPEPPPIVMLALAGLALVFSRRLNSL